MATRQKAGGWGEAGSYRELACVQHGPAQLKNGAPLGISKRMMHVKRAGRAPIAIAHAMARCAAHVWRRTRAREVGGSAGQPCGASVCAVDPMCAAIATPLRAHHRANSRAEDQCVSVIASVQATSGGHGLAYVWPPKGRKQKRGSSDALAPGVNNTRPPWDSSARATQPPQPCEDETAHTTAACLTANLLDPLLGLPDSISPPPLPPRLLHPIAHFHAAARQHHEAGAPPSKIVNRNFLQVRPSKEPRSSFLIPFELFSNGSKGFENNAPTPANWILKHE